MRAALTSVVFAVIVFAILVLAPNEILTRLHGLTRPAQEAIAVAIFTIGVIAVPVVARRLQRRKLL